MALMKICRARPSGTGLGLAGWPVAKYAAQPEVSMHISDKKERRAPAGSADGAGAERPADDRKPAGKPGEGASSARAGKSSAGRPASVAAQPWYAGQHKDALLYLMIAIFFVELAVGGVAFFYGVMHAAPEVPGGPPMARFPWLGWVLAAILAPVGLILIVHLAGTWVSRFLGREAGDVAASGGGGHAADADQVPERLQRFYAIIRNAPTVVVLLGILLLGAALFFVDGAFTALVALGSSLVPYIPWIAGSVAAMIAVCYLVHRLFIYRHHRMQQEFAYRCRRRKNSAWRWVRPALWTPGQPCRRRTVRRLRKTGKPGKPGNTKSMVRRAAMLRAVRVFHLPETLKTRLRMLK